MKDLTGFRVSTLDSRPRPRGQDDRLAHAENPSGLNPETHLRLDMHERANKIIFTKRV